jgi:ketosteroid isomerase-like protein
MTGLGSPSHDGVILMENTNPVAVVLSLYQQLLSDPQAAIAASLSSDIVWENPLQETVPFGGVFEGHEGCARYLTRLLDAIEMESIAIDHTITEGDRVVLIGRETSRVKKTGRRYTMGWVHVVRCTGGSRLAYANTTIRPPWRLHSGSSANFSGRTQTR